MATTTPGTTRTGRPIGRRPAQLAMPVVRRRSQEVRATTTPNATRTRRPAGYRLAQPGLIVVRRRSQEGRY